MNAPDRGTGAPQRNLFFAGFAVVVRAFPAVLWTYVLSLGLALVFSVRLFGQWKALLGHSMAAQAMTSGFDLGTFASGVLRLNERVPGGNSPSFSGIAVFAIVYFVLVPGTLFCYASSAPARLSTLLGSGVAHFWRFVRITIMTLLVGGLVLGGLWAIQSAATSWIDEHMVGRPAFLLECVGYVVLFLAASLIRLYFDMVEVYTVQMGIEALPGGFQERRVRLALRPAWRTMTRHLAAAWVMFLVLAIFGAVMMGLAVRFAVESLAQPRVWPAFLVGQVGVLSMLFTRFWQRGAETVLAAKHPLLLPSVAADHGAPAPSTGVVPPPPQEGDSALSE